jgi:uncharacterized protein YjbI with pentapeptide repeats
MAVAADLCDSFTRKRQCDKRSAPPLRRARRRKP